MNTDDIEKKEEIKKEDIERIFKKRFCIKYWALALLFFSFVPLLGAIIFPYIPNGEIPFFVSFILMVLTIAISLILIAVFFNAKGFSIPKIKNLSTLQYYLEFLSDKNHKNFRYVEYITWFSWVLYEKTNEKYTDRNNSFNKLIYELYSYDLAPNNNNLSYSATRRGSFTNLANNIIKEIKDAEDNNRDFIIDKNAYDTLIDEIENLQSATEDVKPKTSIIHDKEIFIYIGVTILHFIGCVFLSISNDKLKTNELKQSDTIIYNIRKFLSCIDKNQFLGNLLLALPTDFVAIFVYRGIIKDKYIPKSESSTDT